MVAECNASLESSPVTTVEGTWDEIVDDETVGLCLVVAAAECKTILETSDELAIIASNNA